MRNNVDDYGEVTTGNQKLPLLGNFFRGHHDRCLLNGCIDRDIDRESFKKSPLTKHVYYSHIQLHSPPCEITALYTCSDSGNFFEEVGYFAFIRAVKTVNTSDLVTTSGNLVVTLEQLSLSDDNFQEIMVTNSKKVAGGDCHNEDSKERTSPTPAR